MIAATCPIATAENRTARAIDLRTNNTEAAAMLLVNEFRNAMQADEPGAVKLTALSLSKNAVPMADVMSDLFAGRNGDAALSELLAIVGAVSMGFFQQGRAKAWIAERAAEHAAQNAGLVAADWDGV